MNAIANIGSRLPSYIKGLYYYDYIGNISSSHASREHDHVNFEIQPRFPIFGQWKTDWNQGYNMPTQFHLFQDVQNPLEHTLEVDFMHAYEKSLMDHYTVNVILPEGASDIRVELPSSCGVTNSDI
jgi:oligosaccharyltransferase complex subunit alpha (ribophorin I)